MIYCEKSRIFFFSCPGGQIYGKKNGASDRNRTGDNHVGNVMLYQLSYTRT